MTQLHDPHAHGFASDNYAGVHPEVLAAIAAANDGHQVAYGDDVYTEHLQQVFARTSAPAPRRSPSSTARARTSPRCSRLLPRWGAVIAASTAHINVDEGGAPERVGGIKILTVPTADGKLTPELVDREAWGWGDEHRAQPLVVSITQTTELGTAYTVEEIRALADHAHERGMKLHMDGARISNAAASLGVPLREFTRDAGVDVLSFGGTKNGLLLGEAIVVLNPAAPTGSCSCASSPCSSRRRCASCRRSSSRCSTTTSTCATPSHSNAMAAPPARRARRGHRRGRLPGLAFTQPTQANGVFATLPAGVADRIREQRSASTTGTRATGEVRWMTAFDTTEADVDAFVAAIISEVRVN